MALGSHGLSFHNQFHSLFKRTFKLKLHLIRFSLASYRFYRIFLLSADLLASNFNFKVILTLKLLFSLSFKNIALGAPHNPPRDSVLKTWHKFFPLLLREQTDA